MAAAAAMANPAEMSSSAKICDPACGTRKPAPKRTEVIDLLFARGPSEGVLLQFRPLLCRRGMPG